MLFLLDLMDFFTETPLLLGARWCTNICLMAK